MNSLFAEGHTQATGFDQLLDVAFDALQHAVVVERLVRLARRSEGQHLLVVQAVGDRGGVVGDPDLLQSGVSFDPWRHV